MLPFIISLAADSTAGVSAAGSMYTLVFMILMLVVLYFIMIRPQRKKEKADNEMRKNVQVGDEIETIGGIVGIITKIEEKTVVIETSSDRCKMRIKKWAIATNVSADEEARSKAEAAKAEKAEKKGKKDKDEDKPIEKD